MSATDQRALTVAVVIVTHDSPATMLERACQAVLDTVPDGGGADGDPIVTRDDDGLPDMSVSTIVVDNGGSAAARLRAAGIGPGGGAITVLDVGNHGFAHALNAGFAAALAATDDPERCVLVGMNDDVVVRPGWLEPLVAALDHDPTLAAVQPLLVTTDADGVDRINSAGVELDQHGAAADRRRGDPVESTGELEPVTAVTGGAFAVRAAVLDAVGPLDERFFLYYEDVEWCLRARRAGWGFALVPDSVVDHAGSATTGQLGDRRIEMMERNRLWCTASTGTAATLASGLWLSVRKLRHPPHLAHRRGLFAGVAGLPSRLVQRRPLRRRVRGPR